MATATLAYAPFSQSVGNTNSFSITYNISGTDDIDEATQALIAEAPLRVGNMFLVDSSVKPNNSESQWIGEAKYEMNKPTNEPIFSIEIGVSGAKFTQSLQTVGSYGDGSGPPPDFQGAIGVTKEGVEGCEVNVPSMTWNERHVIPSSRMGRGYIQTLFNLTAKMNQNQFRIFDPGEALFMGCTLAQSGQVDGWEGNFRWVVSPNATNISVGSITVAEKYGHDYLWTLYKKSTSQGATVQIPKAVFVERVYQFGNMGSLQLDDPT